MKLKRKLYWCGIHCLVPCPPQSPPPPLSLDTAWLLSDTYYGSKGRTALFSHEVSSKCISALYVDVLIC